MVKKILIVDDNQDILYTIEKALLNDGYEVEKAISGNECLQYLNSSIPDLILLDIMMPEIDGWDVASKIKENSQWKKVPIVFVTAKNDDMSIRLGTLGSNDYIIKPFEIGELLKTVRKILID